MLKFSLGPGIFHDRFCSDWEFLAEVPAHGIGKKFVPFFLPSSASLDRFVLLDSFAEVCNQMGGAQTQRWLVLPPKGQAACGRWVAQAISLHSRHQQGSVGSDVESGLALNGDIRPYLCLPDSQQVFLLLLIGLDLPAIEISLQGLRNRHRRVTDEQIGRQTIERVSVSMISQGADDDQSHGARPCRTTPQNWSNRLIVQLVPLASRKDGALVPGGGFILSQFLGGWKQAPVGLFSTFSHLFRVGIRLGRFVEADVLADSSDQHDTAIQKVKDRSIAEAGIDNGPEDSIFPCGDGIAPLAQAVEQSGTLCTQSLLRLPFPIVFHLLAVRAAGPGVCCPILLGCALPGFARPFGFSYRRSQVEGNRDGTRRPRGFPRPNQKHRLEKSQGVVQVGVKGRRERVSQNLRRPDSFSGLVAGCVVQRRNQRLTRAQEFWQVFDNGVEQGMRFPAALGEQAVLRRPTAKLPSQNADRSADRATAEADQQSQRMVFGATVCPVIRKAMPPTAQHFAKTEKQRHESPLLLRQHGKRVGPCACEAILTRDPLGKCRNDRFPVERDAMTFGDQSHNLGDVQRAAGAAEYVVYHVNLRHTLDLFRSARRSFLLRRPAQAAERIHLSLGNSFKDIDEVIAKVVWHGSSPLELRGEHTKRIAYVNIKLHTYAKRDKLECRTKVRPTEQGGEG